MNPQAMTTPSSSVQAPPRDQDHHPEKEVGFYCHDDQDDEENGGASYLVQFHDIWVVRNSVMAVKCDFGTGAVKFVFFGAGNSESLSTQVPPNRLREALRAFSAGKDFELTPELAQATPEKHELKQEKAGAPKQVPPPPEKTQVEYSVGDKVVALDHQKNWWLGSILQVRGAGRYQVGFDGCSPQWNEELDFNCIRARLPERLALSAVKTGVTVIYIKENSTFQCAVGVTKPEDSIRAEKCVVAYM